MDWPRPAAGTHLHMLGDEAVLYAQPRQELFAFNTAATLIWCCLELEKTREDTLAQLTSAMQCAPAEAMAHLDACLAQWRGLGILAGSAPAAAAPPLPSPDRSAFTAQPEPPPLRAGAGAIARHYRVLGTAVCVQYPSVDAEDVVHPVVAHLEEAAAARGAVVVAVAQDGETYGVYVDGRPVGACSGRHRLAPYVKAALWQIGIRGHRHLLQVHAGVVSDGETLTLLPAASGRGKSTLTAGLVHAGYQYFSDEAALLEDETFATVPVPFSLCVKAAAWTVLTPIFPVLENLAIHERPDRKLVKYMPPPREALPPALDKSLPVQRIIFPAYEQHAKTALRPLPKAAALARLLGQCLAVPLDLTPERVAALVRWMKAVEVGELVMSSLDEAVSLLRQA